MPERTAVTVGTFDGVHRGHRHVLDELRRAAADLSLAPLVISFEPHPLEVLRPEIAPGLLAPGVERLEILAELGVGKVVIVPFTRRLAELTAEEFVDTILIPRYGARHLLVGYDHGFGRGREGDAEKLREIGVSRGLTVSVVAPVSLPHGAPVSSSAIRRAVEEGDLSAVAAGLGRRYSIRGNVGKGKGRGRTIGFPTLNVVPLSPSKLLPRVGVYAVEVSTPRGSFGGMMNLGPRPTFGDHEVLLEVHLFDATGDFYGAPVRVELIDRIRDTRAFESPQALVEQLAADERSARRALTQVL